MDGCEAEVGIKAED